MSDDRTAPPLVSTDWLAKHLDDPRVRVVEVDEETEAYALGHIPGAVAWHWSRDLQHPLRRDYVDREGLGRLLGRAGVAADTDLVVYGGNNNWFAAYAYWLLKYRGFERVRLLDGGRIRWETEDRLFSTDVPTYEATDYRIAGAGRPGLRAYRDDVLRGLGVSAFVDVRSPDEFTGHKLAPAHLPQEQPYVGGHVPGARNVPWSRATREDGTFRPVEELEALYRGENVLDADEIIAYCRIGERAAHTWFVLHELLGHQGARNYDGSWTEYGSAVGVPVER
jgi:thiosulfate/3-mercaptopyruvate sulfurtransferase